MATCEEVEDLLRKYKQGSRNGYDKFISTFANTSSDDKIVYRSLKALKDCVTLIDRDHETLISVLLKLDWCSKNKSVIEVYQSVILNLVSMNTDFLQPCLKMLVTKFSPDLPLKESDGALEEATVVHNNHVFTCAHTLLRAITKIVPLASSPTVLLPILSNASPYMTKPLYMQECYMRNLIQITYYIPGLRQSILEHIVHKMINYDLQVPRLKLTEDCSEENDESGIFNMDEHSEWQMSADKLDVMLVNLFEYIKSVCYENGELQWEATKRFYREMLYVFEKIILPTYSCSHTQFIMFYIVSLKSELCDGFLDYLWKRVQNPNIQGVYRQAAVIYMGSLLARAQFVSIRTVQRTVELMVCWLHHYTQACGDCVMADITHHGPFYSVCQAVFYVVAFRHRELFETKKGLRWAETLQFQHLVQSRLNPLKVCLPLIVKTFASITRQHQLAFCDHIIEQNNRSFLPVVSDATQKMLEAYFPFDPYLLERSKHYIEDQYREYEGRVEVDEDSGASEDEEDEMFTQDMMSSHDVAMATTPGSLIDKAHIDLMSYGTSPGFSHVT